MSRSRLFLVACITVSFAIAAAGFREDGSSLDLPPIDWEQEDG